MSSPSLTAPPPSGRGSALRFLVLMGLVAMCGDITYEGARSVTGPYLGLLGASASTIGFFVGLGEFLGYGLRVVTGWFADRTRAYYRLTALGYGLNLIAVPGLAFVGSSTVPGVGVPMVLLSGRLAAQRVAAMARR